VFSVLSLLLLSLILGDFGLLVVENMGDLDDDAIFTFFGCVVLGGASPLVLSSAAFIISLPLLITPALLLLLALFTVEFGFWLLEGLVELALLLLVVVLELLDALSVKLLVLLLPSEVLSKSTILSTDLEKAGVVFQSASPPAAVVVVVARGGGGGGGATSADNNFLIGLALKASSS
jgi:hypothetical protein